MRPSALPAWGLAFCILHSAFCIAAGGESAAALEGRLRASILAAVNEVKTRNPQAFAEMSAKCSRSMVKPKDIPLYTAWSLIHSK